MAKVGRNDPCPCGSGKKYKKCCMGKDAPGTPLPRIVTPDGEEMIFLEAHYDCADRTEAIRLLASTDDFDLDSDDPISASNPEVSFAWLEKGVSAGFRGNKPSKMPSFMALPDQSRLLGNVTLKRDRLILHTNGKSRLAAGKGRLESLLAGLIRHRLDSVQSLKSAMNAAEMKGQDFGTETLGPHPVIPAGDKRFAPLAEGETLHDAIENRGFESLEEINLFTDRVMQDYNSRPQADMAGLSPVQAWRLLNTDWEDEDCPLRLNKSLAREDVRDTPLLHNARALIGLCESQGGTKVTSAGNLNRKAVAELIPQLNLMKERSLRYLFEERSIINEQDIWLLHLTRVIIGLAGLIRKYKGRFVSTKRGRRLMEDGNLSQLYHHLFLTTFQKFNLGYISHVGHPDIQSTITYSFHVLGKLPAGVWQDAEEGMSDILLPAVRDRLYEAIRSEHAQIIIKSSVNGWILDPLAWFGLVETQEGDPFQIKAFRTTPLFAKFITFHY